MVADESIEERESDMRSKSRDWVREVMGGAGRVRGMARENMWTSSPSTSMRSMISLAGGSVQASSGT